MRIDEALARYLVQLEANGRSPHTIGQCRRHVRLFARWAAHEGLSGRVAAVDHEDVARFMASKEANTRPDGGQKRASSTNALRSSLRTFFRFAHDANYAAENPARLVQRAQCQSPPPRVLSDDEQRRLLSVLETGDGTAAERDHMMMHLLLRTGIRLGSCIALDVQDVDLEAGEIRLRKAKGGCQQVVFLGREIRGHLRRHMSGCDRGPLFRGATGRRISTRHVQRRLCLWFGRAGIRRPVSPHSLRHTFAADLYRRTSDILLVQRALGHRSVASTMVYVRVDDERLRAAM